MVETAIAMSAPIQRTAPDTIRLERLLDAPAETVWRYLTEAELRSRWFMGGTDARPNGEFELLNDHDNLSDEDVPYPESYAPYKGKHGTRRCCASNRRACWRPPSKAGRTAKSGLSYFPRVSRPVSS